MKKNKLILLIVLAALLIVYIILRIGRPEEKLRPVYDLDSLSIQGIEVFDQANKLVLKKQKGIWLLSEPVAWEADTLRMNSLFKEVFAAKYPKTPMGEGPDAVKRFKLQDSEALHIVVSGKGRKIHTLFSNMGNPYDYFRFAGSEEVYQIKAKVFNNYTTELPMWRSPHVVNYEEDELLKIDVSLPKDAYTLTRNGYDWYYQNKTEKFLIPTTNLALMKLVNILANLDTYVFVDTVSTEIAERFKNPEYIVKLSLSQNRSQDMKFAKYDDKQFMMMVDNDPSVLFIISTDTIHRFNRSADLFKMRGYGT